MPPVFYALRKPDAELSLFDFERRYPDIPYGQTGVALGRLAELAFSEGESFHNDGFTIGVASGVFEERELSSSKPVNYSPKGNIWAPHKEFDCRRVIGGTIAEDNLLARNREHAETILANQGYDFTFLEPRGNMDGSFLQLFTSSFNPKNWKDCSRRLKVKRTGALAPLVLMAGLAVGGYAYHNSHGVARDKLAIVPQVPMSSSIPGTNAMNVSASLPIQQGTNVNYSPVVSSQTQQVARAVAPVVPAQIAPPIVKTNNLERVVAGVPQVKKNRVVRYDLTSAGKIVVEKEPMLVYANTLAQANEFPFIFSREYESGTIIVPTLVQQDGKVKRVLDFSPSGIKATKPGATFPAKGARLITPNGLWCELDSKKFGTNEVYVFPRMNGSFYAINSKGANIQSDSNGNISLTSVNGIYSTKPLAKREYLERRASGN